MPRSPARLAPNRLADSESQARNSNLDTAIQGFTTAEQWDPSLPSLPSFDPGDRFAPRVRANELAKTAQSPSQR